MAFCNIDSAQNRIEKNGPPVKESLTEIPFQVYNDGD